MSNSIEPTTEQVGYFRTTERDFEHTLMFSDLSESDITSLPDNAVIVEMGSGLSQNFSNGILKINPKLTAVSIDPSLGLDLKNKFNSLTNRDKNGKLTSVSYQRRSDLPLRSDQEEVMLVTQEERIKIANQTKNVIVGIAPSVPFAPNSISLFIDNFGPCLYLPREELVPYTHNIVRALKPGGVAKLFPLDFYREANISEIFEERNERAKLVYSKVLDAISDISYSFYEIHDKGQNSTRVGVSITKNKKSSVS